MKKAKDYWTPIFEMFTNEHWSIADRVVDWYPCGQYKLAIKLDDDVQYEYDWTTKALIKLSDTEDEMARTEEDWRNIFSRRLIRKLYTSGISQLRLSELTDISPVMINRYIKGLATPSGYNLQKIARALSCSIDELIY